MTPLRILTWHVHGNYLYYLTQTPHEFFLPVGKPDVGYAGAAPGFPWSHRVHDIPFDRVSSMEFDLILYQSQDHYIYDQHHLLSERQRRLPVVFLEHDPPQDHPTNTHHVVDDPTALLVHVTHFNALMWNSGRTPTAVIEHGVVVPHNALYRGEISKGLVVINNLRQRGRRLGLDIFERVREEVPLDLVGIDSESLGGLGEISHEELPWIMCQYRFLFNPIRYTSLGLSVCEAMALGMPIIGLATTEMVTAIENGYSGYVDTNVDALIPRMQTLLRHPAYARQLSEGARATGQRRFNIERFVHDWNKLFLQAVRQRRTEQEASLIMTHSVLAERGR